jgi:hypothetical protein
MMELLYVLGRNLTEEIPKPKPKPRPAERRGAAVVLLSVSGLGGGCDVANIDFPHRQQTLLPRGAMFPPARVGLIGKDGGMRTAVMREEYDKASYRRVTALIGNDLSRCTSNDTETTDGWVVENRPHWPMRGGTPSYSLAAAGDV